MIQKVKVMRDTYNEFNRSEYQRRRFPVKFKDDLRREICLRYALGESTGEIYWDVNGRGIHCSYNAIRHYLISKRWRRFMATIMVSDIADPVFHRMLREIIAKRQEQWDQLVKTFFECMELAVSKNPPEAQDFAKIIKILRQLKRLPVGCRRQI